jgi:hypothetical protein
MRDHRFVRGRSLASHIAGGRPTGLRDARQYAPTVSRCRGPYSLAIFGMTSVPNSSSERSASASDMVPRNR